MSIREPDTSFQVQNAKFVDQVVEHLVGDHAARLEGPWPRTELGTSATSAVVEIASIRAAGEFTIYPERQSTQSP